ncbi:MAG: DUF5777 family beta-barrel protein [Bacteroidia bacterium]
MAKQLHIFLLACFTAVIPFGLLAQTGGDDLSKLLEEAVAAQDEPEYATASFKTTRLINGHSSEQVHAGVMDMRISHRFGAVNGGIYNFFGLDNATMRMALEYGALSWLTVGLGRSTYEKTYDGFLKTRIARQSSGKRVFPITLNYMSSMAIKTIKPPPDKAYKKTSNFYYTHQLIMARKFSDAFSFLVAPTLVHRNLVQDSTQNHDLFSIGMGGRIKLTKRISFNAEYYHQLNKPDGTSNCLSLGFDIETGGHVFQFTLSNSAAMIERGFIHETTGLWGNGDIVTGFCISRNFTLIDPRKRSK